MSIGGQNTNFGDVLKLITFVQDVQAFKASIAEFEAARAAADKSIALVGQVKEIPALREAAAKAQAEAAAVLQAANLEVKRITGLAESQAQRTLEQANADIAEKLKQTEDALYRTGKAEQEAQDKLQEAKATETFATNLKAKLEAELAKAVATNVTLEKERIEVARIKADLQEKHRAFLAAIN